VWREKDCGKTEFTAAGCPEEYKKISSIVKNAIEMIIDGAQKQDVFDYIIKELFPNINMVKLINRIKEKNTIYETEILLLSSYETILPEFIDTYIHLTKKKKKIIIS